MINVSPLSWELRKAAVQQGCKSSVGYDRVVFSGCFICKCVRLPVTSFYSNIPNSAAVLHTTGIRGVKRGSQLSRGGVETRTQG